MGIANSIIDAASKEARRYPGHRAAKVGLVIGEYAGVDTESLRFCFETLAEGMELDITWRIGGDELKFTYLEMEEVADEGVNREEGSKRERSNSSAAA
jgi:Hydrogenase/urease nickel incorporation, metallochaperone, hypA